MRKLSKKKYLAAFVITLLVFTLGMLTGLLIEHAQVSNSRTIILEEKANLQSLQLQQQFIMSGETNCQALEGLITYNIDNLGEKIAYIETYNKKGIFNEEEFKMSLREYFLTEIQFLSTLDKIEKECGKEVVKVIYFYDDQPTNQGAVLDYLKKRYGSQVLVFSFDSNVKEEPMIHVLMKTYNVTEFPSVVIDGTLYSGQTSVDDLIPQIEEEIKKIK
jgi:hypothetical protein